MPELQPVRVAEVRAARENMEQNAILTEAQERIYQRLIEQFDPMMETHEPQESEGEHEGMHEAHYHRSGKLLLGKFAVSMGVSRAEVYVEGVKVDELGRRDWGFTVIERIEDSPEGVPQRTVNDYTVRHEPQAEYMMGNEHIVEIERFDQETKKWKKVKTQLEKAISFAGDAETNDEERDQVGEFIVGEIVRELAFEAATGTRKNRFTQAAWFSLVVRILDLQQQLHSQQQPVSISHEKMIDDILNPKES